MHSKQRMYDDAHRKDNHHHAAVAEAVVETSESVYHFLFVVAAKIVVRVVGVGVVVLNALYVEKSLVHYPAAAGDGVRNKPENAYLESHDSKHSHQHQGLYMSAALAQACVNDEAHRKHQRGKHEYSSNSEEGLERLSHHVVADNRSAGALDVAPHRLEQAALAKLRVCVDVHGHYLGAVCAGGDDGLQRVGVVGEHVKAHRGFSCVAAESAGGVHNVGAARLSYNAASELL